MKAIIIGSSTGIGQALARVLDDAGIRLALTGRNVEKMHQIAAELKHPVEIAMLDLCDVEQSAQTLHALIAKMNGVDLIIVNSGVGGPNYELNWNKEKHVIDVNVSGFTRMMDESFNYFLKRGGGHIVGVSSIAGVRGFWHSPAYNASKAYAGSYMEALRSKAAHLKVPIVITDVAPGFVLTPLTEGKPSMFWVASPLKAARQIYAAICAKKGRIYITRRWLLIAILLRLLPEKFYIYLINRAKQRDPNEENRV